jgi:ABC-type sugar transport system ATPase subunit
MNFVDGRVEGGTFISADLRLPLATARWPHMPSGAATLGIRPDQLRVEPGAATGDAVPAVIRAVERLGDRTDVVLVDNYQVMHGRDVFTGERMHAVTWFQ